MTVDTTVRISQTLEQIKEEFQRKMQEALEPARRRLDEIARERAELDREEAKLLAYLGEKTEKAPRRRNARRVTAIHKKEVLAKFVREGHIQNGTEMTKSLRTALADEGIGSNDFRKLNEYLPSGWTAKSNGARGTAAKTVFYQN